VSAAISDGVQVLQGADLLITNAAVRTLDSAHPLASALAVRDSRIAGVGSAKVVCGLVGPDARVIDAQGRLVLPGFNDAHVHFLSGGFQLKGLDLRDAESPKEFAERVAAFASKTPRGQWITGGDWDHEKWTGSPLPAREWSDHQTPDHPVFITRLDGHMGLANSLALRLAGITRDTTNSPGGLIVRDPATGEPTGLLKDAAMTAVSAVIPPPTWEEKLDAARAATTHAAQLGLTSVQDMSANDDVGIYQELLERGELKTRIAAFWPLPAWEKLAAIGVRAGFGDAWLRIGGLKGFADGSLGSTTALFFAPYCDAPETCGLASPELLARGTMRARIMGADRVGLQVAIHAIGDRANAEVLGLYEEVVREHGARDRRFRIEHAQHLRPEDTRRFGRAGVIASMQPFHTTDDGRWAEKRIGAERCRTTYAFRSLLDAGATLAFGSDWTVAPLNPLLGIAAAVTRRTLDGRHPNGWVPEQKISVEEAVRAYTTGSAFAEHEEKEKGSLAPGKLADFVMLDRDIFSVPPEEIEETRVRLTVVGGRVVYEDLPR